jgi:multidrug efflux pump subunit AcrB
MWIVKIALNRPYTFIVMALLILILSPVVIYRTPTDIFPSINMPVISVAWQYTGLNPEELEGRLTSVYERNLTGLVDNIEHLESTTVNGLVTVKIFLQPNARLDTANAQVTALSQYVLRQMPPGTRPPEIINYSPSSVPIVQLGLSGTGLSEQQLFDFGQNFIRPQLVTVPGAVVPSPYGGKLRQVTINLNPSLLQSKGLSATDVLNAVDQQNLILPSGTAKIDQFEYDVRVNTSPKTVAELNDLPLKVVGNSTIYLRDVAYASDGFSPQTNIVRQDGQRGVLITILKAGAASTINVVNGIRQLLPRVALTLPPELKIRPVGDQSIFVRAAVGAVVREAVLAAGLTGVLIFMFLGNWRSTIIIAVSIPLSILTSIIFLAVLGETVNLMTLGGLALAVGILVDDATVTVENIERYIREGHDLSSAIFEGAAQIAVPALVSTLCICIVLLPIFFLSGVARYLFVPLAEAVVFAMLASYVFSRTLVPTMAMYLLRPQQQGDTRSRNPLKLLQQAFERRFERFRFAYRHLLATIVRHRSIVVPVFLLVCVSAFLLVPWLGEDFFPSIDSGQFVLHMRAKTGTRIEETAKLCDFVEASIRRTIPPGEIDNVLDNIGLPNSLVSTMYDRSGVIGAGDADILVSLSKDHHPTSDYVRELRNNLAREFPGTVFYFLPADMVNQILNFGAPAPIDIQINGADLVANRDIADRMLTELRRVPGLVDLRIQQAFDYPTLDVAVDRTKAALSGLTEKDIAGSMLNSLSGSFQITPMFYLNWQNGISYNLVVQAPQYKIQSLQDLRTVPITSLTMAQPRILADVASIQRSNEMEVISRYNLRRVIDIYGSVQDRDLGAVGNEINRIVDANRKLLPRGSFLTVRGQLETMRTSYIGLLAGVAFAIILVYLLIVVNFQSWLDPFIIITALPAALAGIVVFLFMTRTTLSVPALMGAIMCMGVATANSILVVAFAKEQLASHGDPLQAAIEAAFTRFRPVIITALAMIIGMSPMALGMGEGGEQNAPLGRAVIGGLTCATLATLILVPCIFSMLHRGRSFDRSQDEAQSGNAPSAL